MAKGTAKDTPIQQDSIPKNIIPSREAADTPLSHDTNHDTNPINNTIEQDVSAENSVTSKYKSEVNKNAALEM